jgi:hypothetical protein
MWISYRGFVDLKRRSILALLSIAVVASIALSGLAISGTTYTWEKTFEVTQPEIECEIEISDCRIVGCPVKVCVMLKVDACCSEDCWERHEWERKCGDWEDDCDECEDDCGHCWKCDCEMNGTYASHLYWWNETMSDWQHVMHLAEDMNITLGCWKHVETHSFVPMWQGEYKVVVMFTVHAETYAFSSED